MMVTTVWPWATIVKRCRLAAASGTDAGYHTGRRRAGSGGAGWPPSAPAARSAVVPRPPGPGRRLPTAQPRRRVPGGARTAVRPARIVRRGSCGTPPDATPPRDAGRARSRRADTPPAPGVSGRTTPRRTSFCPNDVTLAGTDMPIRDGPLPPAVTRWQAGENTGRQGTDGSNGKLEDGHQAALNGPAISNETGNRAHRFTSAPAVGRVPGAGLAALVRSRTAAASSSTAVTRRLGSPVTAGRAILWAPAGRPPDRWRIIAARSLSRPIDRRRPRFTGS
jgi:hypothetical protein